MSLQELKDSGKIIYDVIVGSIAYGTNIATSDEDRKGFYYVDPSEYLSLNPPVTPDKAQINDDKHDNVYYSLYRAFELLKTANPNMIELLWIPECCIKHINHDVMDIMLENRKLFITKQAYHSHANYAIDQIKRAKGKNKKVHNPQPKEMPKQEDFCYLIGFNHKEECIRNVSILSARAMFSWHGYILDRFGGSESLQIFPARPVPVSTLQVDLSKYHVSSVEHIANTYRLYYYGLNGDNPKGVFRGDMIVCESIPKDDEILRFSGLLYFGKDEYQKALKEWHSYWDWVKYRNDSRWIDQESGLMDYDAKNMNHCVRLLISSESILVNGEPLVRIEGENREYLMKIRNAELAYDEIMEDVQKREKRLHELFEKCNLPENVNEEKMNWLYGEMLKKGEGFFSRK